jgi:hypothetical protein
VHEYGHQRRCAYGICYTAHRHTRSAFTHIPYLLRCPPLISGPISTSTSTLTAFSFDRLTPPRCKLLEPSPNHRARHDLSPAPDHSPPHIAIPTSLPRLRTTASVWALIPRRRSPICHLRGVQQL